MAKIVTVDEMRRIEQAADAAGHSYDAMMELAGAAVAQEVLDRVDEIAASSVLILAGTGNNGGDALVAGELLAAAGAQVSAYLTKERAADDPHLAKLRQRGLLIAAAEQDQRARVLKLQLGKADIIVDGVLGTGIELPLRGGAQEVLKATQAALALRDPRPLVVAVDCPSGVDCDSGAAAPEALKADFTVTLAAAKRGLLKPPAVELVGDLIVADIGIPSKEFERIELELVSAAVVRGWLPARPASAHKGTFGRALVIGGSRRYPGAALLAAEAAYLSGAGLVTCAVPEAIQAMLVARLPEATWIPLPEEDGGIGPTAIEILAAEWDSFDSMLIGPGLGLAEAAEELIRRLTQDVTKLPPLVVDADGLKHLAGLDDWHKRLPAGTILTPHPGEMQVLTGHSIQEIQEDREAMARHWAEAWKQVVVLKGAYTVIAEPEGATSVLPFAHPALARAGTGDVLAGVFVGLRAQGVAPYPAAVLGGYLHGRAGVLAAEEIGSPTAVVAGDVAGMLAHALWELEAG